MHYSQLIWIHLGEVITQYLNSTSQDYIPRVEISLFNVIYIIPYPSLLLYTHDKLTRNAFHILTQEIKRDNIYKCMNLPPSGRQVTSPQRLVAHLDSTIRRLHSFLQYIASAKFGEAVSVLQLMRDLNLDSP
jgi:hypothetical protein